MGPTTKAISVTGGITFEELIEHFRVQALGLMAGGADYLLLETAQDTRNVKAGLIGIERAFDPGRMAGAGRGLGDDRDHRHACSAARTPRRSRPRSLHADLLYVGLNCATGPELMADHSAPCRVCRTPVACVPNAGLPDEEGSYREGPEVLRRSAFARFLDAGWLNLVGGCCGTTRRPRPRPGRPGSGARAAARSRITTGLWSPGSKRSS